MVCHGCFNQILVRFQNRFKHISRALVQTLRPRCNEYMMYSHITPKFLHAFHTHAEHISKRFLLHYSQYVLGIRTCHGYVTQFFYMFSLTACARTQILCTTLGPRCQLGVCVPSWRMDMDHIFGTHTCVKFMVRPKCPGFSLNWAKHVVIAIVPSFG